MRALYFVRTTSNIYFRMLASNYEEAVCSIHNEDQKLLLINSINKPWRNAIVLVTYRIMKFSLRIMADFADNSRFTTE